MAFVRAPDQAPTSASLSHAIPIVFVVDDDVSVRESLEALIRYAGWQPETFASAQDFLVASTSRGAELPDPRRQPAGSQRPRSAEAVSPATGIDMPIIFITGYGDVPMTVRAMKAGAVEFLTKPFDDDSAAGRHPARHRAQPGGARETRRSSRRCATATRHSAAANARSWRWWSSGLLNKQVGGELGISEITVKAHRGQVMRKMQARSLADLVNMNARLLLAPAVSG